MRLRALTGLALCLALAPAAAQDAKKELEKLQGTWKVTKFETSESNATPPKDFLTAIRIVIEGDNWKLRYEGETLQELTIKIDPGKSPKHIDSAEKGAVPEGIYTLEGDTLKIFTGPAGGPRPTAFKVAEDSRGVLITLKREKK